MTLYTIGHSTRSLEELLEILNSFSVQRLVDIRTIPRSRKNPQFNREALAKQLPKAGLEYAHEKRLGGLRKPKKDSINTAWENASFRGYADYMETEDFQEGLNELIEGSQGAITAIMCAESVPWRCHRSLVADALTVRGIKTVHLMAPGMSLPHTVTRFARVQGTRLVYDLDLGEKKKAPKRSKASKPLKRGPNSAAGG
jgi:uncharacterized protein (DUF488 family)